MSLRDLEFRVTDDGVFVYHDDKAQYRNGKTDKRACIMTPNGPIYLNADVEDNGTVRFTVSYPDVLQMTHGEFQGEDPDAEKDWY